jgi:phage terminase large subunit-like protein
VATTAPRTPRPRPLRLERTLGPLVVAWIEENLVHGPGDVQGQPIVLDDEQVRFVFRAYEIDDRGRRIVRRAVYSRPKGRAKSELAAMIVCVEGLGPARFDGWASNGMPMGRPVTSPIILCVATEEGQADNTYAAVHYMLAEGAVADTPGLDVGLTRTFLPGGGYIRAISAKASSKDGGKETFANFDEPHLYTTPELHRLAATIRRNLAKRKAAQPWSLETTTMYAPDEESVAEHSHRYAQAIEEGKVRDPGFLFDHHQGPDPASFDWDDDDQLRAALVEAYGEAAEWMDLERLICEARDPETRRSDFVRYFLNRPAASDDETFVNLERWDELADGPPIEDGREACLGWDGSRTHDTTVVAWASRAEDGRIDVDCRIWSARQEAPHHELCEGGKIDYQAVEDFVVEDCFGRLRVEEVAYDPRYVDRSADIVTERLGDAQIAPVEPSSRLMRDALAAFHRGVTDGTLRHRGDPRVRAHIAATKAHQDERGWIVRKRQHRRPIDAVIAMALAYWRVSVRESVEPWAAVW